MKKLSDKKLLPVEIGSTVRVPVPDADKGRLNARNILAFVTEVHIKNIFLLVFYYYKLCFFF